jgi:NTE family protein
LASSEYLPDWVAGISIGAINAAIIAGNRPDERLKHLRAFWNEITAHTGSWPDELGWPFAAWQRQASALMAVMYGQPGFFAPRHVHDWFSPKKRISFYDTSALKGTLERLVDFERINKAQDIRLSVGAVNVRTGQFTYFDSVKMPIRAEHIMASGALAPGFPADRNR